MPQLLNPSQTNLVAVPSQAQPVAAPQQQQAQPQAPPDPFRRQPGPPIMIIPHDDHASGGDSGEQPVRQSRAATMAQPARLAASSPKGGMLVRGVHYPSGQRLPDEADPSKQHSQQSLPAAPTPMSTRERLKSAIAKHRQPAKMSKGLPGTNIEGTSLGDDNPMSRFAGKYIHPDNLYRGDAGMVPTETFLAFDDESVPVRRARGTHPHHLMLEDLAGEGQFDMPPAGIEPRDEAVWRGLILGRTARTTSGHMLASFWNPPEQRGAIQRYVAREIRDGNIHPHHDFISFSGNAGPVRAGDFVKGDPKSWSEAAWDPSILAKAHVDADLKRMLNPGAGGVKHPYQKAMEEAGLITPGHHWWAPVSEQRDGGVVKMSAMDAQGVSGKSKPPEPRVPSLFGSSPDIEPVSGQDADWDDFFFRSFGERTPDHIYTYHQPTETFIVGHDGQVHRSYDEEATHGDILSEMGERHTNRIRHIKDGMVMGRTGLVHGRTVMAFWNGPEDRDKMARHVAKELADDDLAHDSWVSVRGERYLVPATEFAATAAPKSWSEADWDPSLLAKAHVNPELRRLVGGAGGGVKHPYQAALEKAGLLTPGHRWWAPVSEQRQGEPVLMSCREKIKMAIRKRGKVIRSPSNQIDDGGMDASPVSLSRFIGTTHKFMTPASDGPVAYQRPEHQAMMEDHFRRLLGRSPDHPTIAALFGWVPGTNMQVYSDEPGRSISAMVGDVGDSNGGDYSANRTLAIHPTSGLPYIKNESIHIPKFDWYGNPNRFRGLSASVLARQIVAAHEAGIPRIETHAAQTPQYRGHKPSSMDFVGGLHWALMGYDGRIDKIDFERIPPHVIQAVVSTAGKKFLKTRSVFDLISNPVGVEWWKSNPQEFHGFVDTHPGSRTRRRIMSSLEDSVQKHKQNAEQEQPQPAQMARPHVGPGHERSAAEAKTDYQEGLDYLIRTGKVHPDHCDLFC